MGGIQTVSQLPLLPSTLPPLELYAELMEKYRSPFKDGANLPATLKQAQHQLDQELVNNFKLFTNLVEKLYKLA
ncbi:MAG: hypothetical protein MUO97_11825 [Dehalococcoidia bacterium]|nr:hypothetical protein [Dehalococcoidia bacterium]